MQIGSKQRGKRVASHISLNTTSVVSGLQTRKQVACKRTVQRLRRLGQLRTHPVVLQQLPLLEQRRAGVRGYASASAAASAAAAGGGGARLLLLWRQPRLAV